MNIVPNEARAVGGTVLMQYKAWNKSDVFLEKSKERISLVFAWFLLAEVTYIEVNFELL